MKRKQNNNNLQLPISGRVAGSLEVGGNLRVEGWLDAPNLRTPCKGLFASADSLFARWPEPMPGWWALVGEAMPAEVYRVERGRWITTGCTTDAIDIPIDEISDNISSLQQRVTRVEGDVRAAQEQLADLAYIEPNTVHHMEAQIAESGAEATLTLYNRHGAEIASCVIPVGSGGGSGTGGGGGDSADTVISMRVDRTVAKPGAEVSVQYSYDHVYLTGSDAGVSTGTKATVTLTLRRDGMEVHRKAWHQVGRGTYTVPIGQYLTTGVTEVNLAVSVTDPATGNTRTKQRYTTVTVTDLTLRSLYDISAELATGGHRGGYVEIPFAVGGSGRRRVQLWIDGEQYRQKEVSGSGAVTESFVIDIFPLAYGVHSAQLVAEADVTDNEGVQHTLRSESIYFTFLKSDGTRAYTGISCTDPEGAIRGPGEWPRLSARQYAPVEFDFVVYDPSNILAEATIQAGGDTRTLMVYRATQHYSNRFATAGDTAVTITCGDSQARVEVTVEAAQIDIGVAHAGCVMELAAAGRSNSEEHPAQWASGSYTTDFEGVDWTTSGWTGESLRLINGAKAVIDCRLFATDVKTTGYTFEIELLVDNITDASAPVLHCIDDGKGLMVSGAEIMFATGATINYLDEDGVEQTRQLKLSTNYVSGTEGGHKRWIRIAHTVKPEREAPVTELYVNGNRVGADVYDSAFSFRQSTPAPITIDSAGANVEVRTVRVYNRALSDDEVLDNSIAETGDTNEMLDRYEENAVVNENGVDMAALRSCGKAVLRIIHANTDPGTGDGPLDDVFATNNKSRDFTADVYYLPSAEDARLGAREFVARNCYIRIQGTSSTKYPSKNIRIYLAKGADGHCLEVGGAPDASEAYALGPATPPQQVLCAKTDYSDSSMSLNTGGAKLFNDTFKQLGLLTPPQRAQAQAEGAITVRAAIDGRPVDVFAAQSVDGQNVYYGQYNLNNEKSKSAGVFGMAGVEGYVPECPLALESLNNSKAMCLFRCEGGSDADIEAWMGCAEGNGSAVTNFDAAMEVNYSAHGADGDVKWAGLNAAERRALVRLWRWVRLCVPEDADYADIASWQSAKFADEIGEYFDVDYLLTYYIWTDYFLSVDQRAKNILWRTWDGLKWYPTYYDGDTQMGKSNDSFMSYGYATTRDTWDARLGKYAFEGHDSWLWCLVLANFEDRLRQCAAALRGVLTNTRVLQMLNVEQSGNWCDRVFNKSGYIKYIRPAIETVYGQKWQFIFALQGNNRPHREYFVRNRFAVLDARYGCGGYRDDNIDLYLQQGAGDASTFAIEPSEAYVFGYSTNNPGIDNAILGSTGVVDRAATVTVTGAYTANDPLRLYGASRIARLDARGACGAFKNGLKLQKCEVLRSLDLSVPEGGTPSTGWWIEIDNCRRLAEINLRGQTGVRTGTATSTAINLSAQTALQSLDARDTLIESVTLAPGAPVHTLLLPESVSTLVLRQLPHLAMYSGSTGRGLYMASCANLRSLDVQGCPGLDTKQMVQAWMAAVNDADALTLRDISWSMSSPQLLLDILEKVSDIDITGQITITGNVWESERQSITQRVASISGLRVHFTGGTIIATSATNPKLIEKAQDKGWIPSGATTMTAAQAAAVTSLATGTSNGLFQNSSIESLDELRYFTSITEIPMNFCLSATSLKRVTLPDSVTQIITSAFEGCSRLERVVMGRGIATIKGRVFFACPKLGHIEIPAPPGSVSITAACFNSATGSANSTTNSILVPTGTAEGWAQKLSGFYGAPNWAIYDTLNVN